nr:hypothetical protein [Mesorhizobium sp.]
MEAWVGPAIVAAFISGLVSLVVVQLNFRQERRADRLRREEKIRDFQIALRAEIRSELKHLSSFDLDQVYAEIADQYANDESYSVTLPRLAQHIVFNAIVTEIHILPESVIDPVVLYVRQRQVVESMTEDIRDAQFRLLSRDRQLAMYRDYLGLWKVWRDFAEKAERALQAGAIQ